MISFACTENLIKKQKTGIYLKIKNYKQYYKPFKSFDWYCSEGDKQSFKMEVFYYTYPEIKFILLKFHVGMMDGTILFKIDKNQLKEISRIEYDSV